MTKKLRLPSPLPMTEILNIRFLDGIMGALFPTRKKEILPRSRPGSPVD